MGQFSDVINNPARRNPRRVGSLSAMLCKACVVALKGDVLGMTRLEPPATVSVRSRSQTGGDFHHCYLAPGRAWLPLGHVTYHLGLLFLAEGLACAGEAGDLLDALEEILEYRQSTPDLDARYLELLMHLTDELFYWAKWREAPEPLRALERLDGLAVLDAAASPEVTIAAALDPAVLTDLGALRTHRAAGQEVPVEESLPGPRGRFRGPQLRELVQGLDLGLHCLLVGPTATGKSLCAREAFERTLCRKPVFVLEGHESLKEFDLLGGYAPDGEGGFAWHDGALVQAMRAGGYLFLDEANRMPTRTLNVLLGALSCGAVVLTEHGSEQVQAQAGFQVVMAMNLGRGYAVNTLDTALLNRFACVLEFRYLPAKEEEELLVGETGVDPDVARTMVKVANETRRLKRNKELSGEITPRGLFAWAVVFQAGREGVLARLKAAARVTWMHQVAGTDADGYLREDTLNLLLDLIAAHTPS